MRRKQREEDKMENILKRKKLNKRENGHPEIMFITYFFVILFLCLIGYLSYFTATSKEFVVNNSYNPRQELLASQTVRGSILSKEGEVLAETKTSASGTEKRIYPQGNLFAHVVGFSSHGRMGIESMANYNLISSGIDMNKKAKNELEGRKNPGDTVITTLDVTLQKTVYEALGVYQGAVVVMEPDTGKILAMVSKPDFNPNEIKTIWEDIIEDKASTVLLNRATQGIYPPGSTFKIVTALEYMRENPDTYQDYYYNCNGKFKIGESKINCYHGTSHGSEDLKKAFAKSCNSAFADIGTSLNHENFSKTLDGLLFNEKLPAAFTSNQSTVIVDADTSDSDMVQIAIGQGTAQITPLHMAMITASVANSGILMNPYVIDRIVNQEEELLAQNHPVKYGEVMTASEAAALTELMTEVIQTGTGSKLKKAGYTAAGKTGSAEFNGVKEDSHAWFTGFAPAENPEIVVTIIIEGVGSGGDYAVPIAKRIFDAYFNEQ